MDNALPPAPPTPPADEPKPFIAYHGPTPAAPVTVLREVIYERQGSALVIHIPPTPISRQIMVRSVFLLICAVLFTSLAIFVAREMWLTYWRGYGVGNAVAEMACPLIVVAGLAFGIVVGILGVIRTVRVGRDHSTIRVWPEGIDVKVCGTVRGSGFEVRRDRIAHLHIYPTGRAGGPKLNLEIIGVDDSLYFVTFPWPANTPMIELEDNLRDVLGLGPKID